VDTYKSSFYICGGQLVYEEFGSLFCLDFHGNGVLIQFIFSIEEPLLKFLVGINGSYTFQIMEYCLSYSLIILRIQVMLS